MFKKTVVYILGAVAISAGVASVASARTEPAVAGNRRVPGTDNLFTFGISDGRVTSTGNADFNIPLAVDNPGLKNVAVTCGSTVASTRWRAVGNNSTGTATSASLFVNCPVLAGSAVVDTLAGAVNVPAGGVLIVDAIMNAGGRLLRVNWNQ
jgi:hypothetical protein